MLAPLRESTAIPHNERVRQVRRKNPPDEKQESDFLFEMPERPEPDTEPLLKPLQHPIWTENKAKLIERYLYYFVLITKHGTYIDGFAGPQQPDKPEMWAAKLVLENQPRWLRQIHLFEKNKKRFRQLEALKKNQPPRSRKEPKRNIVLYHCDFKVNVHKLLKSKSISE